MDGRVLDWRLAGSAPLAGAAVVAAALALPAPPPDSAYATDPVDRLPEPLAESAPEDLSAFLEIRRWGAPPEEPPAPEPSGEEAAPALNPVLAEMGFVGLIAAPDERAVLLALPEGEIVRMLPGDTLPDGRILVSVADNSLTLEAGGGATEVLTLFPPLPGEVAPPLAVPEGGEGRGGDGDTLLPGASGAVASQ